MAPALRAADGRRLVEMSAWRPTSRLGLLVAVLLVPAVVGAIVQFSPRRAGAVESPPNIVLILTDDQRADTLGYMPIVQRTLGKHGVTFTNAYVSNPVCCPSRATILTGLYSHSTGVYTNDLYGGFAAFDDDSTIATWLHDAGYRTGLFGKYLNGYESDYTPPGWDRWFATHESGDYYDYSATSDGTIVDYGEDPADYGTSVVGDQTISFIRDTPAEQPLFAYMSLPAPHEPGDPGAGRRGRLRQARALATSQLQRKDVKDKPKYIRNNPWMKADRRRELDRVRVRELRTLPAVDRLVGDVIDALQRDRTPPEHDRGLHLGQRGAVGRAPMGFEGRAVRGEHRGPADRPVRRGDPGGPEDANLITNLDFAPTFAEAAGATTPFVEGRASSRCCSTRRSVADRLPDRARGLARGQRRPLLLRLPHEALRPRPVQRRRGRALRSASSIPGSATTSSDRPTTRRCRPR